MRMTFLKDTQVTYPSGTESDSGKVLYAGAVDVRGRTISGFITDSTPFHPLDPYWPDQPSDQGKVWDGVKTIPILAAHVVVSRSGEKFEPQPALPKRGEVGASFLILHEIAPGDCPLMEALVGREVDLTVDHDRRQRLSAVHTAAHLMAFALNERTAVYWLKGAREDGRGNADFDQSFIARAVIGETTSRDVYRLGKSARKSGFDVESFASDLDEIGATVTRAVNRWRETGATVRILPPTSPLMGRRTWSCKLPDETLSLPCGGTHVDALTEIGPIVVRLTRSSEEPNEFEVSTTVQDMVIGR
ncbi:MAG: hypothetical protein K2Y04_02690 [Caulobacteraceae bacterium]|nr:hypothetical protein [Caulobacteraceae bacterium]